MKKILQPLFFLLIFCFFLNFWHPLPEAIQQIIHETFSLIIFITPSILLGIFFIGILSKIPDKLLHKTLGNSSGYKGIFRAAILGILFDVCNHGVILLAANLYKRGINIAYIFTFLIATPWNSLSTTLLLWRLMGLPITLSFILFSLIIAIFTGIITQQILLRYHLLPANPQQEKKQAPQKLKGIGQEILISLSKPLKFSQNALKKSIPILHWIFLGIFLTACTRVFIPSEWISSHLGPTLSGLFLTLGIASMIEICSDSSAPLATEINKIGNAQGNAFTFLMAGVATDTSEILTLRGSTKSWRIAFCLPLITIPQILLIGYFLN